MQLSLTWRPYATSTLSRALLPGAVTALTKLGYNKTRENPINNSIQRCGNISIRSQDKGLRGLRVSFGVAQMHAGISSHKMNKSL